VFIPRTLLGLRLETPSLDGPDLAGIWANAHAVCDAHHKVLL